jgi:cyclase
MIKRITATLILDSNQIVNAYNFQVHLPIGKLKYTLERLQEFEVDEINILNTSHSNSVANDLDKLLEDINNWHVSTPLAYGGGISTLTDAVHVIKSGVERVIISAKTFFDFDLFSDICRTLGDQAIILHLPIEFKGGSPSIRGHNNKLLSDVNALIPVNWGGEIMLTIVESDGKKFPNWQNIGEALGIMVDHSNFILAGGFADFNDVSAGLSLDQVSAISIGNYLHRVEHSVIEIKQKIRSSIQIRR